MPLLNFNKGATLIELSISLAVFAIIAASAISYTPTLVQSQRSDSAIKNTIQMFKLARTEAITGGSIVTICPLNTDGTCTNQWHQPISVFSDPDNSRSLNTTEVVLLQIEPPSVGRIQAAPSGRRYFQFGPLGGAKGTLGNLTYCPEFTADTRFIRRLIVSFSGRIRLAQDKNNDGQVEDADGSPVTCH
jgi:prepilin-type N-terminal cleavage/methylation domain-containing protein